MAKITSLLTSAFVSMVCLFTMCINIAEAETYIEDVFVGLKGANFSSPNLRMSTQTIYGTFGHSSPPDVSVCLLHSITLTLKNIMTI